MSSIDDLLRYDDDAPRRRPRPGSWRIVRIIVQSVVIGAVAAYIGGKVGLHGSTVLFIGALLAVSAIGEMLRTVRDDPIPSTLRHIPASVRDPRSADGNSDGIRIAIRRWESQLEWTSADPDRFAAAIGPAVAELVDERLRLAHGISLRDAPERARQLVDPALWSFIHDHIRRSATPAELAALVTKLEEL